ncbi:MAG TPA: hypothetical protein VEL28_07300 [Candidatus Binatia bacterium]|nr:hypothetical protein [Candidatus Binatia bacterium]
MALAGLVRKAFESPATLTPVDLEPLRRVAGNAAIDYVLVLGGFHFINRMADLLHVDSEFVPESMSRIPFMRRVSVFFGTLLMGRMDLANRPFAKTFEQACRDIEPSYLRGTGRQVGEDLRPLHACPKMVEVLKLALDERDVHSSLSRETVARVHGLVEEYLPACIEQAQGFHPRPSDPVEAFIFVGTRYPARTTAEMVEALRAAGYDDIGILDLATAIADANQWARMHRLLRLPRDILSPNVGDRDHSLAI